MFRLLLALALFAGAEAFVAPTSAVATRATVRAAEPVMFGGSAKAKPAPKAVRKATKKVAKKAAPAPKKGKPAAKAARKAVKRAAPKPAAKKAAPVAKKSSYTGMLSKSGKSDSFLNRIYGTSTRSLYP